MSMNWGEITMQAAVHQEEMRRREAGYLKRADAFLREDSKRTSLAAKLIPMVRRARIGRSKRPQSVRSSRPQHETP